ncbi:thiol peroxidase [Myxococcota bacterium]|jgi:thiol peroxidase|nr:thiol peroxidase [Myxococcota bacterium]MBU1413340.1 thiol peroxidase [Myxococcota bacterium]MBU1511488.1 thiol peroxidase [Myxococcota bacterium]PKN24527.1 MAG: thiol peroxidase [Deltaproteobacteria bacterium HGW-Deltaproteobacteria-22]
MSSTKLQGQPVRLSGSFLGVGDTAPDFKLTRSDLSDVSLADFAGKKRLVLNIFPSIDTPVCAASVRRFNELAAAAPDTAVLCISRDLPFAHARFCAADGIENVVTLSELRDTAFGAAYGLTIAEGPLAGLLARAVLVLDEDRRVVHAELVDDITHEPAYEAVPL